MTDLPTKSTKRIFSDENDGHLRWPICQFFFFRKFPEFIFYINVYFSIFLDFKLENLKKISNAKVLGTLLPVSLGSSHSRGSHRTSHYGFVGCPTECACKINEEKNIIADCSDKELGAIPKFKNDIKTRLIRL